ncbi:MAG: TolC family protein [Prevotella sp.]|jgi:outer membrane protein TolC
MRISLSELFQLVEKNNPSLQAQRSYSEAADEALKAAKSQRLPDVNASLSASYIGNALLTDRHFGDAHGLHSPHFGNSFALEAAQAIYAGGAINAGIRKAEIAGQMSKSQLNQTRLEQRFLALGQWLDLYRKDNAINVVKKNIELTRQLIDQIKNRQQQGLALKNDITRYELQLQQLQLRQTQLTNERLIANHTLNNTLGLDEKTYIECDSNVIAQAFGRDPEHEWQQLASTESPRLQQARQAAEMAQQDVKLARAALLPKVSIFAVDNFNGPITYEIPPINKNINIWTVGIGISYPISGLFKSNHQLRQARKAQSAAQSDYAAAALQTNNAVQQAHTLYEQSYVELATEQKNVELAQQNYNVVSERYLNQLALITDMIDASNTKLDAELSEVDARINIAYAYYKMKFIAGTL